jgi:glycosyltransferase involved in cell wall biosynthesis
MNTVAALARKGAQITLLMPQRRMDPGLSEDDLRSYFEVSGDFRLVQRPSRWASGKIGPSTLWLRRVWRDPEVAGADLLYSRIPNMLVMGRGCPIPFAIDHYRPWPDHLPVLRPAIRRTAASHKCVGLVIHSHFAAQSYARCGVDPSKILVAHNGADPERMLPILSREEARRQLGLPQDRLIVVYAGRVNARKGLDRLLAMARLRPDILFLIVGSEGQGPVEAEAAALSNVRVVPWQAPGSLPPWLYAADLLVIPPSSAPLERHRTCVLPIKLFQYLAAGRPILAPVSADTAELLNDDNAVLVPPNDSAAAVAALDRIFVDAQLARRLGEEARRLSHGLSWDARAEKILAFIEQRREALR